jgi:tight adherence protein C
MMLLVPFALFLVLLSAITYFGYRQYVRPGSLYHRLAQTATVEEMDADESKEEKKLHVQVFEKIGNAVPINDNISQIRRDLISAGYRSEKAASVFSGIRLTTTIFLPLLVFTFRDSLTHNHNLGIVMTIFAGVAGYLGPGMVLERLVDRRQKTLRLSLPDALDLMVVAVEAGLGLDQAIYYTAKELAVAHKELCDELSLMGLEIRAGTRRSDAFRSMAERTGEPEIKKLVSMLIQTDRFGTSVADSLRTHSDFMRVRRKQDAEERAAKVGVKLVFPIFLFLLPSMILVTAGPGILQLFKNLFPMMHNFGH